MPATLMLVFLLMSETRTTEFPTIEKKEVLRNYFALWYHETDECECGDDEDRDEDKVEQVPATSVSASNS